MKKRRKDSYLCSAIVILLWFLLFPCGKNTYIFPQTLLPHRYPHHYPHHYPLLVFLFPLKKEQRGEVHLPGRRRRGREGDEKEKKEAETAKKQVSMPPGCHLSFGSTLPLKKCNGSKTLFRTFSWGRTPPPSPGLV